jgi:hypothetical protein
LTVAFFGGSIPLTLILPYMQDKYEQMIQALAEQQRAERTRHILEEIKPETERRSRRRGFENEGVAFAALQGANGDAPAWFAGVQRATKRQDQNGTDFYVRVRIEGPPGNHPKIYHLPFDVKSSKVSTGNVSQSRRNRARQKYGKVPITGLMSDGWRKAQALRDEVYRLVQEDPLLRAWFKARRYRLKNPSQR